jgi:pilus assembly protein CpaE
VLCAVADPDTARALTGLLHQLPGVATGPTLPDSGGLLDTLTRAAEGGLAELPEVVVVHDRIGPTPALEAVREISARFPAVGVVLLTADPSPAVLSGAMDAGARGVAALPLSYDDLGNRVEAAAGWATGVRRHLGARTEPLPEAARGTLVAVAGAKGGVGTTLIAVEFALAAHAAGRTVALVDLDLQGGDVGSYLDVRFGRSMADLAGITEVTARVLADAMYVHEAGPALLLAPGDGERGEEVGDRAARVVLQALRQRYEVVVVDCGTQLTNASAVAVETADTAALVTTPDVLSVRAAKRMVRMWDRLRVRKPQDVTVAVNRHSRASEIQPPLIARITGTRIAAATVPAAWKELQQAVDAGRLQDLENRSTVKQACWALAAELGVTEPREATAPDGGTAPPGGPGIPAARAPAAAAHGRRGRRALERGGRPAKGLPGPARDDSGQVTLETLGMTPLILVVLVIVWQAVLAGYTFTLAGDAADRGARAAAVGEAAGPAARRDLPGAWRSGSSVGTSRVDGLAGVTVGLKVPVLFPGAVHFPLTVHGHASAVDEEDER